MQTQETRIINQCTYTPVDPEPKNFVAKLPFLKQAILGIVFDNQDLAILLLKNLSESKSYDLPKLRDAVTFMGKGDMYGTIEVLRDLDIQEVISFAEEALKVEKSLLEGAQKDVDKAISLMVERQEVSAESVAEIRKEMVNMRESIISEVHNTLESFVADLRSESADTEAKVIRPLETFATIERDEPRIVSPSQPELNYEMLRGELIKRFPATAEFLETIGILSTSDSETFPALSMQVEISRIHLLQKEKVLQSVIKEMKVEPVGWLHLERLHFTPIGYDRGELVYSLPLLPHETVRLSHREWSRTEKEFSKLVFTQLESASEEALSEKSELTQSSNAQRQHSSGHNASITVSGGFGPVNISSNYTYNCKDSATKSQKSSSKRSQDITRKASSRVKKEHKTSFKVTTSYELEEQSFREIKNESDQAIRWDFHRLMKKWRIDLYRYDIRLTFDLIIPEPGSYLLRKYLELKGLIAEMLKPLEIPFALSDIKHENDKWMDLAEEFGVSLERPPKQDYKITKQMEVTYTGQNHHGLGVLEIQLPDDYECSEAAVVNYDTLSYGRVFPLQSNNKKRLSGRSGSLHWTFEYSFYSNIAKQGNSMKLIVDVTGKLTDSAYKKWQTQCYEQLLDVVKSNHEEKRQSLKERHDVLLDELSREDALMLRKLEKEEITKGVIRWILGPTFEFYPSKTLMLPDLSLPDSGTDTTLEYYDTKTQSVKGKNVWQSTFIYGELIKFIHQAIEWENINYILYPYFWTDVDRWDFKQFLYHDDYIHRSFLRAGAARVVLTIRRGFEKKFLSFMEGGLFELLQPGHQYMSIADELEAMAKSHFPYTQDANIEKEEYMFTWENVPGSEEGELRRSLRQDFYIDWAEDNGVKIDKNNGDQTIVVSINEKINIGETNSKVEGAVEISLDEKNDTATLIVTSGKSYELKTKQEGNTLKVYREQNLVDTWYEYTPTGALDVVDGTGGQ